jgi:hypothetical protein
MDSLESPHDEPTKVTLYGVQRTTFVSGAGAAVDNAVQGRVGWRLWGYCTAVEDDAQALLGRTGGLLRRELGGLGGLGGLSPPEPKVVSAGNGAEQRLRWWY